MSKLLKSKILLGVMVFAVMFVGVAAIKPAAASADCSITMSLSMGMRNSEVTCLQNTLGVSPATGYFGSKTKAAVVAWQAANGLPSTGLFGSMSRAKLAGGSTVATTSGCAAGAMFNSQTGAPCSTSTSTVAGCAAGAMFSSTTGASCSGTTGPLVGVSGTIEDINTLSQYSSEEVGAGQKDVKVLGFDVVASKDGDISITSMKLVFDATGNGGSDSDRLQDYVSSVSVWQGSTKLATVAATDFNKDSTGIYNKTVSFASNAVVRADKTEKFYVSVDAIANLDSGDIDSDSWTVALESLRYVDGSGVTTTEVTEIPTDMDYDSAGDGIAISFVTFSSASDTELKLSTNNTPTAQVIKISDTNDTDNVVLLKGKMKLEGTSNVWFDELPVTLVSTGDSIDALAKSVTLKIGSSEFTESLGANCVSTCASNTTSVVTFDNLDMNISAGSTVEFTVMADLNDIEETAVTATDFDEGDTLAASVTTTNRAAIVVENAEGDALTDGTEITGSVTGEAQQFYSTAVNVVMGTAKITPTANTTTGDVTSVYYEIPLTVTAFGDTLYLGQTAQNAATATASNAFAFVFQNSGAPTTTDTSVTVSGITLETTNATIESNGYRLDEGETRNFVLKATLTAATNNTSYRIQVKQARTFTEAGLVTGTSRALSPDVSYRTGFQLLNN